MPAENNSQDKQKNTSVSQIWRWLRLPAYILTALLLITIGLVTFLLNDSTRVKGLIEHLVSSTTDRPFHIHGDFDLTLGKNIKIYATDIEWENPVWSSTPNMLSVKQARASIPLHSIFSPPVIIENAAVQNGQLEFEWTDSDKMNWYLGEPTTTDHEESNTPIKPLPLVLGATKIDDVDLIFKAPGFSSPVVLSIIHLENKTDKENQLVITTDIKVNGEHASVQGKIGPFPELIVAGAVDIDAHIIGPNTTFDLESHTDELLTLSGLDLNLHWQGSEIADVLKLLNLQPVTKGPMDFKIKLDTDKKSIDGNLKGTVGEFIFDGSLHAKDRHTLEGVQFSLNSSGPSAHTIGWFAGIDETEGLPKTPYELRIKANSTAAGLHVSELYTKTARAKLTGTALLRNPPTLNDMDMTVTLKGHNLNQFQGLSKIVDFPELPFTLNAKVTSNGQGKADSLNGKLTLGEMHTEVTATLTEKPDFSGSVFKYTLAFPHAHTLAEFFKIQLQKPAALNASGQADITKSGIELKDIHAELGENKTIINGFISTEGSDSAIELKSRITGKNAADLVSYLETTDKVPALPYDFSGTIAINDNLVTLKNITGKIGTSNLKTSGTIKPGKTISNIELKVTAEGSNLDELITLDIPNKTETDPFLISSNLNISETGINISDLSAKINNGHLKGSLTSGWPDHPEDIKFDIVASGTDLTKTLPSIAGYDPAQVTFELNAKGEADDKRIKISRASLRLGSAHGNLKGTLNLSPNVSTKNIKLNLQGKKLSDLGSFEGWDVADVPFSITASMDGPQNKVVVDNLNMSLGDNNLTGNITIGGTSKLHINLDLQSKNIIIGSILTKEQDEALFAAVSRPGNSANKRLIPDMPLQFEKLNKIDMHTKIAIDKLSRDQDAITDFVFESTLQEGVLNVEKLKWKGNNLKKGKENFVDIHFKVQPTDQSYDLSLRTTARGLRMEIFDMSATPDADYNGHDFDIMLTSQGNNLQTVMAELNGYIWARGSGRKVENRMTNIILGDFFTQLINLVNPYSKKETYTHIVCDLFFFQAENGILRTAPTILYRTDKLDVMSVGDINLKTEEISFGFGTTPRTGIGISAGDLINPFVRLGGTLAEPKLTIDKTGSLLEGGAAYATAGLSIIAKSIYKRWIRPDQSCSRYTKNATNYLSKLYPDDLPKD